ncbi:hypothetical protein Gotur_011404 [Gossypium turneri]
MTPEVAEIMDKLKDKKAEYEVIASSDSSVHLDDIDNWIITEVLGPESSQQYMPSGSQAQAKVQRLKDQMAQMQATTVKVQRKYEELQLQLKAEAAAREAEAAAREAEAAVREAKQIKKYDKLQQQLQNMMKMFQQSQHLPS